MAVEFEKTFFYNFATAGLNKFECDVKNNLRFNYVDVDSSEFKNAWIENNEEDRSVIAAIPYFFWELIRAVYDFAVVVLGALPFLFTGNLDRLRAHAFSFVRDLEACWGNILITFGDAKGHFYVGEADLNRTAYKMYFEHQANKVKIQVIQDPDRIVEDQEGSSEEGPNNQPTTATGQGRTHMPEATINSDASIHESEEDQEEDQLECIKDYYSSRDSIEQFFNDNKFDLILKAAEKFSSLEDSTQERIDQLYDYVAKEFSSRLRLQDSLKAVEAGRVSPDKKVQLLVHISRLLLRTSQLKDALTVAKKITTEAIEERANLFYDLGRSFLSINDYTNGLEAVKLALDANSTDDYLISSMNHVALTIVGELYTSNKFTEALDGISLLDINRIDIGVDIQDCYTRMFNAYITQGTDSSDEVSITRRYLEHVAKCYKEVPSENVKKEVLNENITSYEELVSKSSFMTPLAELLPDIKQKFEQACYLREANI